MPGHVFVVGGDLTRLACDDVLVPTDRGLRVAAGWRPLLPTDVAPAPAQGDAPGDDAGGGPGSAQPDLAVPGSWSGSARVLALGGGPRCTWLVDTVGAEGRGLPWLLEGAREALQAVAARAVPVPVHGRARRLVALPALGTGWGVAAGDRGALLDRLLPVLRDAAQEHGFDVALVLREPSDLAAAQESRRRRAEGWALPEPLAEVARRLGRQALAGELAVFAGAGVGVAAGLPTWAQLLEELAERCALDDVLRTGLAALPPQDAAALLAREIGHEGLAAYVQDRFAERPYALTHALLAGLPVQEYVTTNYDPLLELAATGVGRPVRVLPFDEPEPGTPWLLKLHGDARRPESIVLTREQYLHSGDDRAALAGVLHALLLTRHVLFVGSSMLDDDLVRIAHEVRQARGSGPGERRAGTVLTLQEDAARARLWEQDVDTVAVARAGTEAVEAARTLEVLLDLVGCLASPPTGYLLDPAYRGLLGDDEAALASALLGLAEQVGEGPRRTWAWQQVADLLRRLGADPDGSSRARPS